MIKEREWQVDGVHVEISPCSWMYADYGLQLKVSLTPNACNAESEFLTDKSLKWQDTARADADRMLSEFMKNGGVAKLQQAVADWAIKSAEFEKEIIAENKREAKRIARLDAKYRKQGCTHRVDAWIHPSVGGDDFQVTVYCSGEPTKAEIEARLTKLGSRRCDDFRVVSLTETVH